MCQKLVISEDLSSVPTLPLTQLALGIRNVRVLCTLRPREYIFVVPRLPRRWQIKTTRNFGCDIFYSIVIYRNFPAPHINLYALSKFTEMSAWNCACEHCAKHSYMIDTVVDSSANGEQLVPFLITDALVNSTCFITAQK